MIKLIFRKSDRFLLSFEIDSNGEVQNIIGDDSWFNYLYAPGGVKRIDDPVAWANLLKESYRGTPVNLFVLENSKKKKTLLKPVGVALFLVFLIGAGGFLFLKPGTKKNKPTQVVVSKSAKSFKKTFNQGRGRFVLTINDAQVTGFFKKGVVVINDSGNLNKRTWTNQFLFTEGRQGETKKPIDNFNDFRQPFLLMILSMMPENIRLSEKYSKKKLGEDKLAVQGKSLSQSGVLIKGSDYSLRTDSLNFRPELIEVQKLNKPVGFIIEKIKVEFEYP